MKVSVERLRWFLAGAVVLLLVSLVLLVSYGRYSAKRKMDAILAKNGIHICQESDNVTYTQTVKGRAVFTVRAKKAIPISDGKYTLRGVTMLLYGKTPDDVDRVEGDEFEYDQKTGVAKAIGEVHMDIKAPGALTHKPQAPAGADGAAAPAAGTEQQAGIIHVKTSGLVYLRDLSTAATQERVEFRYAGITCTSKGAEFNTDDNALHLLAEVEMTGVLHGQPATVRGARADLDREKNTIDIQRPVANSRGDSARADHAFLQLDKAGTLQHADANGSVVLESAGRRVTAQRLAAVFGEQNAPQSAVLSGGVTLEGSAARPMHGMAEEADLAFTPKGDVRSVIAKHAVRLTSTVLHPGIPALQREMRGEQITVNFLTGGKSPVLQNLHAVGGAFARGESFTTAKAGTKTAPGSATSGVTSTQVSADDLRAEFATSTSKSKEAVLKHLIGQGHTRLTQTGLNGAAEESSGDSLDAVFVQDVTSGSGLPGQGQDAKLQSAVQTGHVQIHDQAAMKDGKRGALSLAHGERATFDGASDRLTLVGSAAFQQEGTSLSANTVSVEQGTGNAEAQGGVEATLASANHDATHVLADHARMNRTAQTAEFTGTDAHPARMWQAGTQMQAAHLYLDDAKQTLAARPAASGGMVEAMFASQTKTGAAKAQGAPAANANGRAASKQSEGGPGEAAHVVCPALDYSGLRHEAVCTGGVRIREADMQARGQQVVMFLTPVHVQAKPEGQKDAGVLAGPTEMGGSLERMVLSGNVRLDSSAGAGDGEQLVYVAKDGTYVLTGTSAKPPRVANAEQGMVTGPALLFRSGEKTVIVNGAAASNGHEAGGRVHTDVIVHPQN